MKRVLMAGAMVLASVLNAHAGQMVYKWYDTIRPHGHKRPDAVSNTNLAKCNAQFGEQRDGLSPEFKNLHGKSGVSAGVGKDARYSGCERHGDLQQGLPRSKRGLAYGKRFSCLPQRL
jgi:hypothetical protein